MIKEVLEKDYGRLGRGETKSIGKDGLREKGNNQIDSHVSVLDKRENHQKKSPRNRGLIVWSKKTREKEGRTIQIINRGKSQRDRGLTTETLNRDELKEKKESQTGVYTRIGVRSDKEAMSPHMSGRETVFDYVQKKSRNQKRKRIGVGLKEKNSGKRRWLNSKRRNEKQRRNRINILANSSKNNKERKNEDVLKNTYIGSIVQGLVKQLFVIVRMTANRKKEKERVAK